MTANNDKAAITLVAVHTMFAERPDRWISAWEAASILNDGRATTTSYRATVRSRLHELVRHGTLVGRYEAGEELFAHTADCKELVQSISRMAMPVRHQVLGTEPYRPGGSWMPATRQGASDFLAVPSRTPFAVQGGAV